MSVQTQLDRITDAVSGQSTLIRQIKTALKEKNPSASTETEAEATGTPMENNTEALQGLLRTVQDFPVFSEVKLQEKTVTPGASQKYVTPDSGYDGLSAVTVRGDSNLVSGNIKSGVSVFGISGSYAGVELNFEVVGSTSQPSSPKENTIWVNTSKTVTGWCFASEEPETMAEGQVWFSTHMESNGTFNALKVNGIMICPMDAKQKVSGALVDVTAKIYQKGSWVEWFNGTLFENGKDFEPVSGGWYCANNGSRLVTTIPAGSGGSRYHIWTNKKGIDLTNYKTVYITLTGGIQDVSDMCIGIFQSPGNGSNIAPVVHKTQAIIPTGTHAFDVYSLKGEYYIGFGLNRYPAVSTSITTRLDVSAVRLE